MTFNKELQCKATQGWGIVDTMERSDAPQVVREVAGLILMMTGLVAATYALFSL